MRINRLHCAEAIDRDIALPHTLILSERATHYLGTVLRLKAGADVCLFDGLGGEYLAEISNIARRQTTVKLVEFSPINRSSALRIELAIGLSRGDRFDLVLQKATELGVSSIQPLLCQRSDRKPKATQLEKKQLHWQGVVNSACEQCGLNLVPNVETPVSVEHWLKSHTGLNALLLHPAGKSLPVSRIRSMAAENSEFSVAVGPEGGFSDDEVSLMESREFAKLSLGSRILRTETAPLAILSVLQYAAGDLSAT